MKINLLCNLFKNKNSYKELDMRCDISEMQYRGSLEDTFLTKMLEKIPDDFNCGTIMLTMPLLYETQIITEIEKKTFTFIGKGIRRKSMYKFYLPTKDIKIVFSVSECENISHIVYSNAILTDNVIRNL